MKLVKILEQKNLKLKLFQGDITQSGAEVIVNAANKYLEHGGGVAAAIAKACVGSTHEYTRISKEEMLKQIGRNYLEHGEVVVTPAMKLEEKGTKYVIHTVGPICSGVWNDDLKTKLYLAFKAPLEKAEEMKLKTIAFPAVSAGIYGCPIEEVVRTFLEAVKEFSEKAKNLKEVWLFLFDENSVKKAEKVW
ncbi:MAG: [protein ADP-ribosylglutamate] hydrolase [Archaeoglobaceae archaeon]|nr:[protein ADP-ribosylglutamate] hydrolase [Archaeoglobaceae archaeon]MCX8151583.1 [protein ADP-ribosylglutamate] hydrolase [Archaeoglobaceae archaeon]MDW8013139.1 [protein ADP-ribosylglutamate] hydrolase [Archaeoglobaceae archaeon]